MKNEEIFKIQIEIIINSNLYKKKIIDDETYSYVNEILLKRLSLFK